MTESARMVKTDFGLAPETPGWFVVNAMEAQWRKNEQFGEICVFQGKYEFPQLGVNIRVLQPGQPNCYYHEEAGQEDFLVLSGECLLLVEGEERRLKPYDYVHCPPGTSHVFVGAGDGPSVLLMMGVRSAEKRLRYPVSDLARKHGAGVEKETTSPKEAYADVAPWESTRCPWESPPDGGGAATPRG